VIRYPQSTVFTSLASLHSTNTAQHTPISGSTLAPALPKRFGPRQADLLAMHPPQSNWRYRAPRADGYPLPPSSVAGRAPGDARAHFGRDRRLPPKITALCVNFAVFGFFDGLINTLGVTSLKILNIAGERRASRLICNAEYWTSSVLTFSSRVERSAGGAWHYAHELS